MTVPIAYSLVTQPAPYSATPGAVIQTGTAPTTEDVIATAMLFPGCVPLGSLPPPGDSYWDYSATPPAWHTRPPKPTPFSQWDYVAREWLAGDVVARRDAQLALIQAANIAADAENLTWSGHEFQTDALSRDRLREALLDSILATLAGESWSIVWTLADNCTLTMSATDIAAVHRALAARTDAHHQRAQDKRTAINLSTSPEDITWTSEP